MSISEVQHAFSNLFPGLKLEFYTKEHDAHEGSSAKDQYSPELIIKEIRSVHGTQIVIVDPTMSVASLESQFKEQLGLFVQVFRRSNTLWLQTSATDDWSLQEQNRKGIASIQS